MRVNVQGDGIGASQAFPGLLDQSHGLFHTRLGAIETGCFKPLFHGLVRPGADIEPGIKREIHPRVTQRGHGAAIAPTLPVRCDPIRELLALSPAFPGEESAQRLLVIILHERGTDGHMVPTVIRLEIQHRVGQPVAVRHGLSANGNDHVHIMVQLAADDGWINPYHDRINAQRSCRRMEKSRPELVGLARSDTGTRVSWQYGQWRQWAEWKARNGYGDDMRLKRLRDDWADDARSRSLAVQEWRAAMENRPPFLDDGRERHPENLSTHDMERLVSEVFVIAANLNSAADDDEYRAAMREGLHTFDMLRERYGLTQDGLWITATDMDESPIPAHVGKI